MNRSLSLPLYALALVALKSDTLAFMPTDDDADEALMLRYGAGDADAFARLYARHKGPLYRYLLRQCSQPAMAEELFQDVWLKLIAAWSSYVVRAEFTTWRRAGGAAVGGRKSDADPGTVG